MTEQRARRILIVASVICLIALALMVWSIVSPNVVSVMVSMSVGQGLGTMSLVLYLWVVIGDLRRAKVLKDEDKP